MTLLKKIYDCAPVLIQNLAVNLKGFNINRNRYNENFKKSLSGYLKTNSFSINRIKKNRLIKLKKLLIFANKNSPFYRDIFNKHKFIPSNLRSEEELEILPIITKNDVKIFYKDIFTKNANNQPINYNSTSGTTGSGFVFPVTKQCSDNQWAVWWRHRLHHGIKQDSWHAYFGGRPIVPISQKKPPFFRTNIIGRQVMFSSYHMNEENLDSYFKKLTSLKLDWIHGYPSSVALFSEYIIANNLTNKVNISKVTLGAENLSHFQKKLIQKAFNTIPIQHYGLAEGVANISLLKNEKFRVDEDFSYVEFIKHKYNQCKIVGTSLTNFAFPLIRYSTGDLVTLTKEDENGWRCVEDIDGRDEDYLILSDNSRIGRLDHIFKDIERVKECQFVQHKIGEVNLKIVKASNFDLQDEKKIFMSVKSYLGKKINLKIEYVDKILKTSNGKLRFVISKIT